MGFMHQFYATFEGTKNKDLYLAGESYAGKYIPYLADHIYSQNDSSVKLQGILLVDRKLSPLAVSHDRLNRTNADVMGCSQYRRHDCTTTFTHLEVLTKKHSVAWTKQVPD